MEKTFRYRFNITYVPEVKQKAADAISRNPSGTVNADKLPLPDDVANICSGNIPLSSDESIRSHKIAVLNSFQPITWDKVQTSTINDSIFKELMETIEAGIPEDKNKLAKTLHTFHQFRKSLYTLDGVILYKDRILVPPPLRKEILKSLHSAHQGTTSMLSRAESSIF